MIKRTHTAIQLIIVLLSLVVFSTPTPAQEEFDSKVIHQSLDSIEFQIFTAGFNDNSAISESIRQVSKHRSNILRCVNENEKELQTTTNTIGHELIKQLNLKDKLSSDEADLSSKIAKLQGKVTECKLLLEKSNQIIDRLTELQAELKKETLSKRGLPTFSNLGARLQNLPSYLHNAIATKATSSAIKATQSNFVIPSALIVFIGFLLGIFSNRKATLNSAIEQQLFAGQILSRTFYLFNKWSPLGIPLIALLLFLLFVVNIDFSNSYLAKLLTFGIILIGSIIVTKAIANSYRNTTEVDNQSTQTPKRLGRRLATIATLIVLWLIINRSPAVIDTNAASQSLLQSALTSLILICLIGFLLFLPKLGKLPNLFSVTRIFAIIIFALCLILDWAGYHSLSQFLWSGIVFTALSIFAYYLLEKLFRDFYDGLDSGQHPWQKKFRSTLGVADSEPIPGLIWLRLISVFVLWCALAFGFLKSWGVSDSTISTLTSYIRDGFQIGETRVVLINVLIGIIVFSGLLMLFKWFKDNLDKKYLSKSRIDIGARDAIVTITGYVGFVLAAIIGLSVSGFSFGNLAIIAGALSLGIGFGLQNIVNNFVSGIILLFERPIRPGDWIVTGSTEGYVKKISVRSTEVQTFDRSDVIVPNSELISTQVTNWTLRDRYGRLTIPIGVAYGSDTDLVKKILEEIPNDIPEIIKNRPQLPIKVFFRNFGDSTLNFELRCFVYDISGVIGVTSTLNFAIDQKFREHNIEIAFPQLDVHMRTENKD